LQYDDYSIKVAVVVAGRDMSRGSPMKEILLSVVLLLIAPLSLAASDGPDPQFIVHFSTGPSWTDSLPPGEQPGFREHSENLNRLRSDGVIQFGARYDEYGMLVVRAASEQAVRDLLDEDPGVKTGIFVFSIAPLQVFYPWRD
jgi:hypothetical protein